MAVEVGTAYVTLKVDGRQVPAGVRRSMSGADRIAAQAGAASGKAFGKGFGKHAITTEQAVERIGKVSKRAFLIGAAGIGYAEKKAADFNREMATVYTLSHANTRQQQQLAQAAKTVGVNIGYSATQSGAAEEELIKAGVRLKDIMGGGLKGALDLAAAGQTDVATATEVAASAMTQFHLKGAQVPHLADLLAAGADKALGSVTDLGYGLAQVGTVAHQMRLSIEDTTGTLAEFAQNGLLGERGGAAFKQMLLRLANPTKKSADLMDQYNLSLYKANGQMKTMPEIAGNLQRSFQDLTPAQRNAALGTIFGSRAIQAANILVKDGEQVNRRWISSVNDQGFAAHQAAGKMNSLSGDVSKLKAQLENAFINASGKQSFLRELAQDGIRLLKVYNNLSDGQRSFLNTTVVRGTELAGAVYAATKIYKLAKGASELMGWATGTAGLGKGIGKAVEGAALGRATKGVVPVFVTNPGFGKGVGGGVTPGGGRIRRQAERNASRSTAARAGEDVAAATVGSTLLPAAALTVATLTGIFAGRKFNQYATGSGDHNLKKDASRAYDYQSSSGVTKGLTKATDLLQTSSYGTALKNIKKFDDQLAKEAKSHPALAVADYQKALDKTGLSATKLNKILPKTADAMTALDPSITGKWATSLVGDVSKAVTNFSRYQKILHTIPEKIRSYVSTPGAALSVASMVRLKKQYDLTPKQVRTIMRLQGFTQAQIQTVLLHKRFLALPKGVQTKLRADTVKSLADVAALQRRYHLTPKQVNTVMKVSGVDAALGAIRTVTHALAGVHDKSVTLHIQRSGTFSVAGTKVKGEASGGRIVGRGGPTEDNIPIWASNGEYMINAAAYRRHRALVEAINHNRLAAGGAVGQAPAYGSGAGSSGSTHLTFVDADGALIGTFEGVADQRFYANQSLQAQGV